MKPDQLRERLQKFAGSFPTIAEQTGVSYNTIRKLACGTLKNPRIKTIAPLLDWLKGRRA